MKETSGQQLNIIFNETYLQDLDHTIKLWDDSDKQG